MSQKTLGYFHKGTVANTEVRDALSTKGHKVVTRNADHFKAPELEKFDTVVVGEDVPEKTFESMTEAYGETPVQSAEDFLGEPVETKPEVKKPAFDPDKPAAKRKPKKQG